MPSGRGYKACICIFSISKDISSATNGQNVQTQSLQTSLDKLEISYQNFFRNRKKGGGFPKFARKGKFRSILFKSVSVDGNYVSIPKMGSIKMFRDSAEISRARASLQTANVSHRAVRRS